MAEALATGKAEEAPLCPEWPVAQIDAKRAEKRSERWRAAATRKWAIRNIPKILPA